MNSIVIIGGGPAGLALAAGLSKFENCNITVVEKTPYDRIFSGEHVQSQVLPILERLSIPKEILFENSTVCQGIFGIWANRQFSSNGFFNLYGCDFIIHRPEFEKSLAEFLMTKGVKFRLGAFVGKIGKDTIEVENELLSYNYLFDCSGRTSRQFNNQRIVFDNLLGISFYGSPAAKKDSTVIIESVENGWWYYTFNKKMSVTTYFTDSDKYNLEDRNLQKELNKTRIIKNYCKQLEDIPQHKPAFTSILKNTPGEVYQIGDSYFSLDPLSSQGIIKAFGQALYITNFFAESHFEESMRKFYSEQKTTFFQNLKFREYYYKKGWEFYKSEFYKRRIELKLL
jgi:flavin-dependent dehydrogenase